MTACSRSSSATCTRSTVPPFKGTWFFGLLTAFAGGFININVLFELVNIGTLSAFIIVSAGILWMRKTQPNAPRGFRAPGVPVTPILAIVFCFVLIAGLNWETWVRFAVWFGLGLIVYFGYSRKRSSSALSRRPGLTPRSLRLRTEVYRLTDSRWLLS